MQLYSYWRSSCSWRVRIALELKKIPYEYKPVNLLLGEQNESWYREINPAGLVPTLILDDGLVLSQSIAILEYLEETFPHSFSLLPKESKERALIRRFVQTVASDIQPLQNLRIIKSLPEAQRSDWTRNIITNGLSVLQEFSKTYSKGFCFGDQISMADLVLIPQLYNARRYYFNSHFFSFSLVIFPSSLSFPLMSF